MKQTTAWEVLSTAFGDLESLAESVGDNRLSNYSQLQEAFDTLDEILSPICACGHLKNSHDLSRNYCTGCEDNAEDDEITPDHVFDEVPS